MIKGYKRIVNVSTGVVNKVKEEKAVMLIASGEYQEVPDEAPKKKPGRPKKVEDKEE